MPLPLSQDYNEAIQTPEGNFADPDLRRGEAVCNALGIPMPYSGNFADVYQVRCPDGSRWAVKCFTRQAVGLRERYAEISKHLQQAKLPFTVDFTYLEQGIRVAGTWYPVLKMQWVEGLTLNQFVKQHLDKPATLEALFQVWARMAKALRAAQVGHGDLQHGNVLLVREGGGSLALKLIDYDGMWVPALAGKGSGEVGHASYQHPQRIKEGIYSIDVDRFPVLLIATALRALKAKGRELWARYDNGDNMLFKETDLREPKQSALLQELLHLGDAPTTALLVPLVKSLWSGLASVPPLEEAMGAARGTAATPGVPRPSAPSGVSIAPTVAAPLATAIPAEGPGCDFGSSPPTTSEVAFGRPPARNIKRVPLAAWAAAIALLVVGLAVAAAALVAIQGASDGPRPEPRLMQTGPSPTVPIASIPPQRRPAVTAPTKGPDNEDFVPLFNGRDLAGWTTHPKQPGKWQVVKGVIIGYGDEDSYLYTQRDDYRDFHLRVEGRINQNGNSGVFFRSAFGTGNPHNKDNPDPLGYEAEIVGRQGTWSTGSLIAESGERGPVVSVRESPIRPGEWFILEVIAVGNHLVIKVNGQTTADYTDEVIRYGPGRIALQKYDRPTVCEFRKVEIREFLVANTPAVK